MNDFDISVLHKRVWGEFEFICLLWYNLTLCVINLMLVLIKYCCDKEKVYVPKSISESRIAICEPNDTLPY